MRFRSDERDIFSTRAGVGERLSPGVALPFDGVGRSPVAVGDGAAVTCKPSRAAVDRARRSEFDGRARPPSSDRLGPGLLLRHVLHGILGAKTITEGPCRGCRFSLPPIGPASEELA